MAMILQYHVKIIMYTDFGGFTKIHNTHSKKLR